MSASNCSAVVRKSGKSDPSGRVNDTPPAQSKRRVELHRFTKIVMLRLNDFKKGYRSLTSSATSYKAAPISPTVKIVLNRSCRLHKLI